MLGQPSGQSNKQRRVEKEPQIVRGQPNVRSEQKFLSNGQPAPALHDITLRTETPVFVQREVDKQIEVYVEKPRYIEVPVEYSVDITVEVPKENIIHQDVFIERIVDVPVQRRREVEIETVYEHPVEMIVEQPVYYDKVVEKPIKTQVYQEKEMIVVNKIPRQISVDKEVVRQVIQPIDNQIVQKPIYKKVPVYQTREVDVKVNVPVDRIVEVAVDVPFDEVVYRTVEKHVPRDRFVEKRVNKDVEKVIEIPVDKVVEVPYEVLVSTDGRRFDTRERGRSGSRGTSGSLTRNQSQAALLPRGSNTQLTGNQVSRPQTYTQVNTGATTVPLSHSASGALLPSRPAQPTQYTTISTNSVQNGNLVNPQGTSGQVIRSSGQGSYQTQGLDTKPSTVVHGNTYSTTAGLQGTYIGGTSSQYLPSPSTALQGGAVIQRQGSQGSLQPSNNIGQTTHQYQDNSAARYSNTRDRTGHTAYGTTTGIIHTAQALGQPITNTTRVEPSPTVNTVQYLQDNTSTNYSNLRDPRGQTTYGTIAGVTQGSTQPLGHLSTTTTRIEPSSTGQTIHEYKDNGAIGYRSTQPRDNNGHSAYITTTGITHVAQSLGQPITSTRFEPTSSTTTGLQQGTITYGTGRTGQEIGGNLQRGSQQATTVRPSQYISSSTGLEYSPIKDTDRYSGQIAGTYSGLPNSLS